MLYPLASFILISNKYMLVCHSGELCTMQTCCVCCFKLFTSRARERVMHTQHYKNNNRKLPYIPYLDLASAFLIFYSAMNFDYHHAHVNKAQLLFVWTTCILYFSWMPSMFFLLLLFGCKHCVFHCFGASVCVIWSLIKQWPESN